MAMKHFFVGVKGIIYEDGKVLLAHDQRNGKDFWDVVGGRIDDDESIEDTLKRELAEELPNLKTYKIGRLVHAYRLHKDVDGDVSLTLLFYEIKNVVFDGEPQPSEEHSELRWVSIEEAKHTGVISIQDALAALTISKN